MSVSTDEENHVAAVWSLPIQKLMRLFVENGVETKIASGAIPDDGMPEVENPAADLYAAAVGALQKFCNSSQPGGIVQASKQRLGVVGHTTVLIVSEGIHVITDDDDYYGSFRDYKRFIKGHERFFGKVPKHETQKGLLIEGDEMQIWIKDPAVGTSLRGCLKALRDMGAEGCRPDQAIETLKRSDTNFRVTVPHERHFGVMIDEAEADEVIDQLSLHADAKEIRKDGYGIQTVEADRETAARLTGQGLVELMTTFGHMTIVTREAFARLDPQTETRELYGHTVSVFADEFHEPFKRLHKTASSLAARTSGNVDPESIIMRFEVPTPAIAKL